MYFRGMTHPLLEDAHKDGSNAAQVVGSIGPVILDERAGDGVVHEVAQGDVEHAQLQMNTS